MTQDGGKFGYVLGVKVVGKNKKKASERQCKEEEGVTDMQTDREGHSDFEGKEQRCIFGAGVETSPK